MVSGALEASSVRDVTGVDPGSSASRTSTFTFVYLTPLLPVPSPAHTGLVALDTKLGQEKVKVPAGPGCSVLRRSEKGVLGHRLKLSGRGPARPLCQGEREFQVSGGRARHRVTPTDARPKEGGRGDPRALTAKSRDVRRTNEKFRAQHMG